jgi:uncharacterized protein (DUF2237 family)
MYDRPLPGFYRDGCCNSGDNDIGVYVVCIKVTKDFLEFCQARDNDLITPHPEFGFPGLKPGDRWCLYAARWREVHDAGAAPLIILSATHEVMLNYVSLAEFMKHVINLS